MPYFCTNFDISRSHASFFALAGSSSETRYFVAKRSKSVFAKFLENEHFFYLLIPHSRSTQSTLKAILQLYSRLQEVSTWSRSPAPRSACFISLSLSSSRPRAIHHAYTSVVAPDHLSTLLYSLDLSPCPPLHFILQSLHHSPLLLPTPLVSPPTLYEREQQIQTIGQGIIWEIVGLRWSLVC